MLLSYNHIHIFIHLQFSKPSVYQIGVEIKDMYFQMKMMTQQFTLEEMPNFWSPVVYYKTYVSIKCCFVFCSKVLLKQAHTSLGLVCAWFLEITFACDISMHMCMCVSLTPRLVITTHMKEAALTNYKEVLQLACCNNSNRFSIIYQLSHIDSHNQLFK